MSSRDHPFTTLAPVDPALLQQDLDLLVVGGGPAGTAAAFRARELGMRVLVIDFDDVLKRIRDYSKDKLILPDFGGGDRMAFPAGGDCIAELQFEPIDKDDMCASWKGLYARFGVPVLVGVELTGLERAKHGWQALAWNHRAGEAVRLQARHVILALGRGVPRRFDIPGNTDGIAYRLDDPTRYVSGPVCVIGGGTSAAEAVIAISHAKITGSDESQVFWSYRGSKMPRVSQALAGEFFEAYVGNGNIRYCPNSEPAAVVTAPDRAEFLSVRVDRRTNDHRPPETVHLEFAKTSCIACIGEDIPESFLREIGIHMIAGGPRGKKMCVVTPLLETQQPNVYLIGDLLSQEYLETDDFEASRDAFRHVKHRGNIKTSLRDGVFIAEVIRQRLDGRQRIEVHMVDAQPTTAVSDSSVARVTAALGLSPATQAIATDAFIPQATPAVSGWLVSVTPTGIESEQFTLGSSGVVTIGRTGCDINFSNDTALSDRHASISCRAGEYYLRDEGSASGTYLRVRPEAPIPVLPGALLRVGAQILVVGRDQNGFHLDQYDRTGRSIRRHPLNSRPLVLGRNAGPSRPDVALSDNDMTLSRFHVSLSVQGAVIVVQDFGSRNGTYLKIDGEMLIEHQDAFRIGAQQLRLQLREDLPEKTDSRPVQSVPRTGVQPMVDLPAAGQHAAPAVAVAAGPTGAATKPHITFSDQGVSGDADASETLLEWADARNVDIDNECWIGMCGCDVIRIVAGGEHLNEIDEKEKKTLKRKGVEPGPYRLACMARCSGPVIVEVAG